MIQIALNVSVSICQLQNFFHLEERLVWTLFKSIVCKEIGYQLELQLKHKM